MEDEDSLLYEEEYVLRKSKQSRRVTEDAMKDVNLGETKELWNVKINKFLEGEFREKLLKLLKEYKDMFAWSYKDMPCINHEFYRHKIDLKEDVKLIQRHQYRINPNYAKKVKEEINKLL